MRMRQASLVVLCGWLATAGVVAAPPPPATNASTPQNLGPLLEPIRQRHGLPALAGAIVTGQRLVAIGAVGRRRCDADVDVTTADQFHLGSCTKAMTATLIAGLVEKGLLSWDRTVGEVFAELGPRLNPKYRSVTLLQLLAHRGGFAPPEKSWPQGKSFTDMYDLPGSPRQQREAYVALALAQEPANEPGTALLYSNQGYTVAAVMAERAADRSWEELLTGELFQPLGMTSAGFGAMGRPGRIDQPWQHTRVGDQVTPIEPGPRTDNPPVIGPGGTVHCALADWGRFISAHLRGEHQAGGLLAPETYRFLHSTPLDGDYFAGWVTADRSWGGGRVLMHNGSNTMNFAVVWMAPQRGFAVLVASNQGGGTVEKACDEAAAALIGFYLDRR